MGEFVDIRRSARTRILVVDDSEDVADALKAALESFGCQVQVAHDGSSALEMAETFKPDIAFLDIGLPVMDGYELAKHLREEGRTSRGLHLVALTGYGRGADKQRSTAAGFEGHLVKPVDLKRLERIVEELRS